MNFQLAAVMAFFLGTSAFADSTIFNCKVSKILNDSVFEEGLSVEEYPDVYLIKSVDGALEFNAGAMQDWTTKRRDQVRVFQNDQSIVLKARRRIDHYYDSTEVKVEVAKKLDARGVRLGLLSVEKVDATRPVKVARLICK